MLQKGAVTYDGSAGCRDARNLDGALELELDEDGDRLYASHTGSGGGVSVFKRRADGTLRQVSGVAGCINDWGADGCRDGKYLGGGRALELSPDGRQLYFGVNWKF